MASNLACNAGLLGICDKTLTPAGSMKAFEHAALNGQFIIVVGNLSKVY
jgi:hypothetical protein